MSAAVVIQGSTEASTEEQILDATDRLIGRFGLKKMTMEDVAREAGVSRGPSMGTSRTSRPWPSLRLTGS